MSGMTRRVRGKAREERERDEGRTIVVSSAQWLARMRCEYAAPTTQLFLPRDSTHCLIPKVAIGEPDDKRSDGHALIANKRYSWHDLTANMTDDRHSRETHVKHICCLTCLCLVRENAACLCTCTLTREGVSLTSVYKSDHPPLSNQKSIIKKAITDSRTHKIPKCEVYRKIGIRLNQFKTVMPKRCRPQSQQSSRLAPYVQQSHDRHKTNLTNPNPSRQPVVLELWSDRPAQVLRNEPPQSHQTEALVRLELAQSRLRDLPPTHWSVIVQTLTHAVTTAVIIRRDRER